jgi:hypothetical protein
MAAAPTATHFRFTSAQAGGAAAHTSVYDVPVSADTITFGFDAPMDKNTLTPSSIQVKLGLEGIPVNIQQLVSTSLDVYKIVLEDSLLPGARYDIVFADSIKSLSGLRLPTNYRVSFITGESGLYIEGGVLRRGADNITGAHEIFAGDTLTVTPVVVNGTADDVSGQAVAAAYENGRLVGLGVADVAVLKNTTQRETAVALTVSAKPDAVKLYILNSLNGMRPLVYPKPLF